MAARAVTVELAVWLTASSLIAIMVAVGGTVVQVTSATPLPPNATASSSDFYTDLTPGGKEVFRTAPRPVLDPDYTPEGEKIPRLAAPTPEPMIWCRPLSGSTICIREHS
jgi:hypothetical protein